VSLLDIDLNGDPRLVEGSLASGRVGAEEKTLLKFLRANLAVFRIESSDCDFEMSREFVSGSYVQIRANRLFMGLNVAGSMLVAEFDELGTLRRFSGEFARDIKISTKPSLSEADACGIAETFVTAELGSAYVSDSSRLEITKIRFDRLRDKYGECSLTWVVHVRPVHEPDGCGFHVSLSAVDGGIVCQMPDCIE